MPFYEHVYIARQDISPQEVDALTESWKELVTSLGGTVHKTEYWGLRSFTFRIKRNRKGHYVLMNVEAPSPALKELERQENIHENVLRHLTVRVDALDPEPSAMMQRRDRDDRGGGGRGGRDRDRGGRGRRDDELGGYEAEGGAF